MFINLKIFIKINSVIGDYFSCFLSRSNVCYYYSYIMSRWEMIKFNARFSLGVQRRWTPVPALYRLPCSPQSYCVLSLIPPYYWTAETVVHLCRPSGSVAYSEIVTTSLVPIVAVHQLIYHHSLTQNTSVVFLLLVCSQSIVILLLDVTHQLWYLPIAQ